MVDLHSHVLPGLDDGAADLDEALEICRAAAADGIEVLAGTPHVRHDHATTAAGMEAALAELQAAAAGIVRVVGGGELDLDELARPVEELRRFGLGGNPAYLLVETPYVGWPLDFADRVARLAAAGFTPVIAHPERNFDVQTNPALLDAPVAAGALVQLTAASLDGRGTKRADACARTLLERRTAHLVASDAHAPGVRAVGLSAAAAALEDEPLARWLTDGVPRAIVEGTRLPERPEPVRVPRRRFRLFGASGG
jgi:protein-tyrosine phosphatase